MGLEGKLGGGGVGGGDGGGRSGGGGEGNASDGQGLSGTSGGGAGQWGRCAGGSRPGDARGVATAWRACLWRAERRRQRGVAVRPGGCGERAAVAACGSCTWAPPPPRPQQRQKNGGARTGRRRGRRRRQAAGLAPRDEPPHRLGSARRCGRCASPPPTPLPPPTDPRVYVMAATGRTDGWGGRERSGRAPWASAHCVTVFFDCVCFGACSPRGRPRLLGSAAVAAAAAAGVNVGRALARGAGGWWHASVRQGRRGGSSGARDSRDTNAAVPGTEAGAPRPPAHPSSPSPPLWRYGQWGLGGKQRACAPLCGGRVDVGAPDGPPHGGASAATCGAPREGALTAPGGWPSYPDRRWVRVGRAPSRRYTGYGQGASLRVLSTRIPQLWAVGPAQPGHPTAPAAVSRLHSTLQQPLPLRLGCTYVCTICI